MKRPPQAPPENRRKDVMSAPEQATPGRFDFQPSPPHPSANQSHHHPPASRTPPPTPASANHPDRLPGEASSPRTSSRYPRSTDPPTTATPPPPYAASPWARRGDSRKWPAASPRQAKSPSEPPAPSERATRARSDSR